MALATTASQTTLTFSADATVEFKTTRVSPEPASPEPGSPLRTPMPGRSKEFFATPQQSRQHCEVASSAGRVRTYNADNGYVTELPISSPIRREGVAGQPAEP